MRFQGLPALAGMMMVCAALGMAQRATAQDAALVAKAKTGDAAAETKLGDYYANLSTPDGYNQAATWYKKAAEKGYGEAEYKLGIAYCWHEGVPQDFAQGYFEIAVGIGDGVEDSNHWLNFAASHMTAAEVTAAKEKAQRWLAAHPAKK
ncbi:MAG TPA: hypothetical protein VGR64_02725 [Terracidiphilus sp.]|nr:hypothetical protein [Terracidiphilus sp.]